MRGRLWLVGVVLGALAVMPAASAQGATKCTARNAQTVLQTNSARVFSTPYGDTAFRVYACLYSRNRNYLLGIDGDCDPGAAVSRIVLNGRFVGFVETTCNIDQSEDHVVVRDLKTGREKYHVPSAAGQSNSAPSSLVTDLVMSRTGSVAWIADWDSNSGGIANPPDPDDDRQVRKMEPGSPEGGTLLDSGFAIEKRSLALSARTSGGFSRLYWTKSDSPFAAKLN